MSFKSFLNQSITIERAAVSQSAIGSASRTWSAKYSDVPARREVLTDRELVLLGRKGSEATHRFFIDYDDKTITDADRINDGTNRYDIIAVVPQRGRRDIHHIEIVAAIRT